MEDRTYIKLFRKMLGWEWYGDTNTVRVFLHILLRANYKDSKYKGHVIHAGECVFGRKAWSEELGLSERQVRTAISHLKSTNEIAIRATNKFSVITVVNWEFWQVEDGKATNKTTSKKSNKRPTNDQQPTTSKESKNNKNISSSLRSEDIYAGLPDALVETLKDFEEMRKASKAPMTAKAKQLLLANLTKLAGDDTNMKIKILEQSITNSWKGVFPLKEESYAAKPTYSARGYSKRRGVGSRDGRSESVDGNSEDGWGSIPMAGTTP